jgi:hypothetical protein
MPGGGGHHGGPALLFDCEPDFLGDAHRVFV